MLHTCPKCGGKIQYIGLTEAPCNTEDDIGYQYVCHDCGATYTYVISGGRDDTCRGQY